MVTFKKPAWLRTGHYGNPVGIGLFLLPAVALYTLFVIYPIGLSFVYSIIEWQGLRPTWVFNGFKYYALMLKDPVIPAALLNNLRAWVLYAFVQIPLALVLAFVLSRNVRGTGFFRFIYFIPQVTSVLLLGLIFRFFLTTEYGLNGLLRAMGLERLILPWLSKDGIAQWTMNGPQTWAGVGFWVVIFIAAINGIAEDLFDAAKMDGANGWQQLIYVTLPGIRGVMVFTYAITAIWALQAYLYQFIMPVFPGGPLDLTHTLASYATYFVLNEGRSASNWGYASALAVFLFVVCLIASLLVWVVFRWSKRVSGE